MATKQYAVLKSALKGFEDPDTGSQSQGYVNAGKYLIQEVRKDFPNEDTDYARVLVPYLGAEDTWICIRWQKNKYATIEEVTPSEVPQTDFLSDPNAVEESAVVDLLPQFADFEYDLDEAKYPYELPGFKAPQAPPRTNNCCTFVEALLVKAWNDSLPGFEWSMNKHRQMMIYSADDYYSPVTALVESDMAEPHDEDQNPHPWTVIQGWRKQWNGGHTFIIVDHHATTDRVLTLESNSSYKLNGVGYRMIGNLREFPKPPDNWWENEQLWTWERICSIYRYRKQCALRLKNRNWLSA